MKIFLVLFVITLIDRFIDAQQIDPAYPCMTNAECSFLGTNGKDPTCRGGFCVCLNDQQKWTNCTTLTVRLQKEESVEFYKQCKGDWECSFNNSFCNTSRSQCECMKGYVPSVEYQQCLKVAKELSFPCTENKQCSFLPNASCVQNQCICDKGFHAVGNICLKIAPFGGPCTQSEECFYVNGALCTEKKICDCGPNMIIDDAKKNCILLAKTIGDYCIEDKQCSQIKNATCVDEKCQCMQEKHFVKELKSCILNRSIGEPCETDYDCYQVENGTSTPSNAVQCINTMCDCGENYKRQDDKCVSAGVSRSHLSLLIILSTVISILLCQ